MKDTFLEKYASNPANWNDHKEEYQEKCPQTKLNKVRPCKDFNVVRCPICHHLGHPKFYLEQDKSNSHVKYYKRAAIAHVHWLVDQNIGRNYTHGMKSRYPCSDDEVEITARLTPVVYLPQSVRDIFGN